MRRRKVGWIGAAMIALTVLFMIFIPAETENPKQRTDTPAPRTTNTGTKKVKKEEKETYGRDTIEFESKEDFEEEDKISINEKDYEPKGKLLLDENFDYADDLFGFAKASARDGSLKLTEDMSNHEISVKNFDHVIMGQSFVEVSFDWKADFSGTKGKSGLEFRDLYGRLIFAAAGCYRENTKEYEFLCSSSGSASNSDYMVSEPEWTSFSYDDGKVYNIFFRADFVNGKVSAVIRDETGSVAGVMEDADMTATGLAKMAAVNYQSGAVETIDNFKLYGPDDAGDFPLAGKNVIAFGDSIVDGHLYKEAGFVEFLAAKEGMNLEYNYANNGARIMPGGTVNPADGLGGTILDCQVDIAASENRNPDYIIFDGGANDAYTNILKNLGTAGDTKTSTFAGAFRNTIRAMHRYWPGAKIIYVAVHKLTVRDSSIQDQMRELELAVCRDMGVEVADLYTGRWDTTDAAMNRRYAFDALNSAQIPISVENSTGVHPNFTAIEELYVPVVSDTLKRAKDVTISDIAQEPEESSDLEEDLPKEPAGGNQEEAFTGQTTSIQFSSSKYQAAAGRKIVLEPKVEFSGTEPAKLNWKITSNEKYASIDVKKNTCTVKTKKSGAKKTVTIEAEALDGSGVRQTVKIQIMPNAVTKVRVKPAKLSLTAGEKTVLNASVKTNGERANRKLLWTVSDSDSVILKPNKDGSRCMVTARAGASGRTVTITAQSTDGTNKTFDVVLRIQ